MITLYRGLKGDFIKHKKISKKVFPVWLYVTLTGVLVYVFLSAIPIWTAYEVITYWAFANNIIPMVSWEIYPIYCAVLFFLVPTIRIGFPFSATEVTNSIASSSKPRVF